MATRIPLANESRVFSVRIAKTAHGVGRPARGDLFGGKMIAQANCFEDFMLYGKPPPPRQKNVFGSLGGFV